MSGHTTPVTLMIYLLWECIVVRGDKVPLFVEPPGSFTHLKYDCTHTSNPMSYHDASLSPVKMGPEHRLSHPVNCLRNNLTSWAFDRKKKVWFCPTPFCLVWHIRASLNILTCLAFGAEFNPEPFVCACVTTAGSSWLNLQASHLCPHFLGLV